MLELLTEDSESILLVEYVALHHVESLRDGVVFFSDQLDVKVLFDDLSLVVSLWWVRIKLVFNDAIVVYAVEKDLDLLSLGPELALDADPVSLDRLLVQQNKP